MKELARRLSAETENRVVVTPKQEGMSVAERMTIDYKRVMKHYNHLQNVCVGGRETPEQLMAEAVQRAGVTRARWKEIMRAEAEAS